MSSFRRGACIAAACGALLVACDKKSEQAAPPASGIPPLDQPGSAAAPPSNHPVHPSTLGGVGDNPQLPPGHPPMMGGAAPGAAPSGAFGGTTPGGDFDPKTVLSGVIKLD